MKLSTITSAYEHDINCLIGECKATIAPKELRRIEAMYRGERNVLYTIIYSLPCGEERNELFALFAKKEREFYSAKDEAFARLTKITATA